MKKNGTQHAGPGNAEGLAALGICESLLLSLTDLKIISDQDVRDLLTDVATTHNEAAIGSLTPEQHRAVVTIIEHILAGMSDVTPGSSSEEE